MLTVRLVGRTSVALIFCAFAPSAKATLLGTQLTEVSVPKPQESGWKLTFELGASPSIGRSLPDDETGTNTVDESEYLGTFSAKDSLCGVALKFDAGASMSPHLLDMSDRESAIFWQAGVESALRSSPACKSRFDQSGNPINPPWDGHAMSKPTSQVDYYVRYRLTQPFSDLFGRSAAVKHRATLGVAVSGVLDRICTGADLCKSALTYSIAAEVSAQFSSDETQRRFSPKATFGLEFPTGGKIKIKTNLVGQIDSYSDVFLPDGKRRFDKSVTAGVSVDFSDWLHDRGIGNAISVGVGSEYRRRWSNADEKSYERSYLLPVFKIKADL